MVKRESRHKPLHEKLLTIINDHHLTQLQQEPIREDRVLDLLLTNKPGCIKETATIPGISDHDGIILADCDIRPTYIVHQVQAEASSHLRPCKLGGNEERNGDIPTGIFKII